MNDIVPTIKTYDDSIYNNGLLGGIFDPPPLLVSPLVQCAWYVWHDMLVVCSQNLPLLCIHYSNKNRVPSLIEGHV
jgi:hypothetical protein